jgi:hypothetical protein
MAMVSEHRGLYSVPSICAGLGIGRASFYRWQRPGRRAVTEPGRDLAKGENQLSEDLVV